MHGANCEWKSARVQLATQLWRVAGVLRAKSRFALQISSRVHAYDGKTGWLASATNASLTSVLGLVGIAHKAPRIRGLVAAAASWWLLE